MLIQGQKRVSKEEGRSVRPESEEGKRRIEVELSGKLNPTSTREDGAE